MSDPVEDQQAASEEMYEADLQVLKESVVLEAVNWRSGCLKLQIERDPGMDRCLTESLRVQLGLKLIEAIDRYARFIFAHRDDPRCPHCGAPGVCTPQSCGANDF